MGILVVILSKGLNSFGSMVAYIVIVRDNASDVLTYFFYGDSVNTSMIRSLLENRDIVTTFFSLTVMLPLCMLRDFTPLERFSVFKISVLILIAAIVVFLYATSKGNQPQQEQGNDFADHWITVHDGILQSLGTFVFAFAACHTIHLVFQSLKPSQRKYFARTTSLGTTLSAILSMSIGFFAYMTFWDQSTSSMFSLYKPSVWVEMCRGLLCISMLLTYPFPFLTTRELLVLSCVGRHYGKEDDDRTDPMLDSSHQFPQQSQERYSGILLRGSDRQLKLRYHIGLTVTLWMVTVVFALKASNLGSVLNLTGCATGTAISYVLPALFSYKSRGHTLLGTLLLTVGGLVGVIGTFYSFLAL